MGDAKHALEGRRVGRLDRFLVTASAMVDLNPACAGLENAGPMGPGMIGRMYQPMMGLMQQMGGMMQQMGEMLGGGQMSSDRVLQMDRRDDEADKPRMGARGGGSMGLPADGGHGEMMEHMTEMQKRMSEMYAAAQSEEHDVVVEPAR